MADIGPISKGYYPLTADLRGGIAWKGERIEDFWMWNGGFVTDEEGRRRIQTVRVTDLKEAALRYWRDGWIPLRPPDDDLLRKMEDALRGHAGLKMEGVNFPDTPFLTEPGPLPEEFLGPEVKSYLGMARRKET